MEQRSGKLGVYYDKAVQDGFPVVFKIDENKVRISTEFFNKLVVEKALDRGDIPTEYQLTDQVSFLCCKDRIELILNDVASVIEHDKFTQIENYLMKSIPEYNN